MDGLPIEPLGSKILASKGAVQSVRHSLSKHSGLTVVWAGGRPIIRRHRRRSKLHFVAKRTLDVFVAGTLLVLLLPLLAVIALAIRLESPGAAIFRQARVGFRGKQFTILKFRTLRVDSEDASGVSQVQVGDERVTRVGRILRKSSLDELPQLFNILSGTMSLVGPRPHVPNMVAGGRLYSELVPYYHARLNAVPGLTGWAQANGLRGATFDARLAVARVDHDIAYIQNFSFFLDITILLMTAWYEITHFGRGH